MARAPSGWTSRRRSSRPRELQAEHGLEFPLIHASAEDPPLPDGSFDVVFSEYGAAIWCDPKIWIPQAHRLLRPGGRLVFLCNAVLAILCAPPSEEPSGDTLVRPLRGLGRIDWPEPDGTDFHQPLYAPDGPPDEVRYYVRRGWAQRWPCEEVWVARRH